MTLPNSSGVLMGYMLSQQRQLQDCEREMGNYFSTTISHKCAHCPFLNKVIAKESFSFLKIMHTHLSLGREMSIDMVK